MPPDYADAGPPGVYDGPDAQFNEEQYMLYRREMARRYHRPDWQQADYPPIPPDGPDDTAIDVTPVPTPVTPYAAPVYPVKPRQKQASIITNSTSTADPITPVVPTPKAKKPKVVVASAPKPKTGPVNCDKGASIVSGFGFENVTTKSCDGSTLSYSAERGGKPFEVDVNSATGELLAVKKL
jgi:hypothetical protein